MLRMLSNVFVSLGRNTIDATRAFGCSDATVVALVLSIVAITVLAGKILQSEFVLTPSKNTTWAQSTSFVETIKKLVRCHDFRPRYRASLSSFSGSHTVLRSP